MQEEKLDQKKIAALDNETRRKIIDLLKQEPDYPASLAEKIGISKQKTHYHLKKLSESDLIERENNGKKQAYHVKEKKFIYNSSPTNSKFLEEFPDEGLIVVGSPDQHGEDQVRARDGHLAGDIGVRLGELGKNYTTTLDTQVHRDNLFERPIVILGGILTNTVAKKLNSEFPAYFSGESFPYREITTPENTYTDPDIGIISKKDEKIMVAGIRNTGTEAAVKAFQEIDEEEDYIVVKGLDLNGDGEIDDYEVLE
ncbi:MAG: winged helix-turn-helix domain-containing protein [Candidatus Nanohaloarchaea archaeon]